MPHDLGPLLANLDAFVAFVRRRSGDPELATEVVQDALAKALARQEDLRDGDRLLPWFWRIVRNTMHDALARRGRSVHVPDDITAAPPDEQRTVCACLSDALARLPERERQAVQRVDLADQDADAVAGELGLSLGNLKVIRHRARQHLREHLDAICRTCAAHGCLDCHCRDQPPAA